MCILGGSKCGHREGVSTNARVASQAFPQWEEAKANLRGTPQLHIFTLANVVQRPIIVYAHPECTVG